MQVTVKGSDAGTAGALTFENTPPSGSATLKWSIQPRGLTVAGAGYDKLVFSSDVDGSNGGSDTQYPQLVLASGTGASQATAQANGGFEGDLTVTGNVGVTGRSCMVDFGSMQGFLILTRESHGAGAGEHQGLKYQHSRLTQLHQHAQRLFWQR